ncbi:hypothetical protein [Maribacter sp. ACAM166]|uniref:hypothetical protein n=1 Tax=Maribacter sp. ACAM166 TaxID=2508996 RepID=UPI0010FDABA4|nr:hypothetical protein [Maribacter sp. ACAM166]TLP81390.1 hypothetical protein ES765_05115 [Maribacter sp. ACAM166]
MKAAFSEIEKEILKGHLSAIARKHGCSHTTVQEIVAGNYKINTPLRKKIHSGLLKTVEFFLPISE